MCLLYTFSIYGYIFAIALQYSIMTFYIALQHLRDRLLSAKAVMQNKFVISMGTLNLNWTVPTEVVLMLYFDPLRVQPQFRPELAANYYLYLVKGGHPFRP